MYYFEITRKPNNRSEAKGDWRNRHRSWIFRKKNYRYIKISTPSDWKIIHLGSKYIDFVSFLLYNEHI